MTTINEFDLVQDFLNIPGTKVHTEFVKELSGVSRICWFKMDLWWPMSDRDLVFYVDVFDTMDELDGSFVLIGESLSDTDDTDGKTKRESKAEAERLARTRSFSRLLATATTTTSGVDDSTTSDAEAGAEEEAVLSSTSGSVKSAGEGGETTAAEETKEESESESGTMSLKKV